MFVKELRMLLEEPLPRPNSLKMHSRACESFSTMIMTHDMHTGHYKRREALRQNSKKHVGVGCDLERFVERANFAKAGCFDGHAMPRPDFDEIFKQLLPILVLWNLAYAHDGRTARFACF